ncbi:MAG: ABC transporter substrate-binding protein, partial [Kiritimatiellaeota bacterium]|nr:ABC transporter substrate-binding protein [Kiritimatiellota bacterium]
MPVLPPIFNRRALPLWLVNCSLLAVDCCFAAGEATTFRRPMDRIASLDPAQAVSVYASHAVALAYETLLRHAPAPPPYAPAPALAGLPEVSEDGLTLVFTLNPAARFWPDPCLPEDGRPLTAHDVVYTFKRLCDKRGDAASDWILLDRVRGMRDFADATPALAEDAPYPELDSLRALDDHTLQILLARPSPELPWLLTLPSTGIVPHEAVAFYKNRFGGGPPRRGAGPPPAGGGHPREGVGAGP